MTAGPRTSTREKDGLLAAGRLAEDLLEKARAMVRDGLKPVVAVDRVIRAADPAAITAAAFVSLFAAVDQAGPAPPQERPN